ncbi:MAG: hypothetical protein FD180_1076 [Planctomycetota bacterium]|nr:MAG: hypothetical protein FD180_1076 [Planctomycetota bacterium]
MLRGDLFRMSRGRRAHGVRIGFVGLLVVFTAFAWPWDGLQVSTKAGRAMMLAFVWCELIAAAIFIPAFVAPAIAGEREKGTLDILSACPQSDTDLVFGRGMSHAVWALSLLFAGAPFAVGAMVVGGAPLKLGAMAVAHAVLMGAYSVTVSLAASVSSRTVVEASSAAFMWLIGTTGVGAVVTFVSLSLLYSGTRDQSWMVGFFFVGALATLFGIFARIRVAGSVGAVLLGLAGLTGWFQVSSGFGGSAVPTPIVDRTMAILCPWGASLSDLAFEHPLSTGTRFVAWGSHLVFCAFALYVLRRLVRKNGFELGPEGRAAEAPVSRPPARPALSESKGLPARLPAPRPAPAVSNVRFFDSGVTSPDAALHGPPPPRTWTPMVPMAAIANDDAVLRKYRRKAASALPVWDNPVLWKDVKILKNPVSGCLIGIGVAICGLLTLPTIMEIFEGRLDRGFHISLVFDLAFLGLIVAPTCASVMSKERESGNLAILLSCGYPASSIIVGKILSVAWHLRAPLVLVLLRIGLCVLFRPKEGFLAFAIIAISLATLACVSVAVSSLIADSRAAVAVTFITGLVLWAGPFFLSLLDDAGWHLTWVSPVGMLFMSMRESSYWIDSTTPAAPLWLIGESIVAVVAFAVAITGVERESRS